MATKATTSKTAKRTTTKRATSKPASTKGKATTKGKPAKKAEPATPVLATASGVAHPCVAWAAIIEKSGQTQTATARAMGVAPMTMSRLMRGYGIPTANMAVRFAEATGTNVTKVWKGVADYELALALEQAEGRK